jgi:HEPN domain-containing protein
MMQSAKLARLLLQKVKQDQYAVNCLMQDPLVADEVIGFHAQQAIEKSVKAVLSFRHVEYRRTHQLAELVDLLHDHNIFYPSELSEAVALAPFAVEFRYDLLPPSTDAAQRLDRAWAKRCVERIADWASSIVGEGL